MKHLAVACTFVALGLAGCGGGGGSGIPAELVGTYTTTLEQGDLPADPARELADGGPAWKVTIAETGGPDDGPVLIIDSAQERFGNLEAPALRVEGDRLYLDKEECFENGSYVFYDNEYRWALDGSTLTIEPVVNECKDEVALTILASRPWTRTG
ncbi:MAG TPA: hypothetical protein VFU34_03035 [Gaiellaceae bacterium]|nr:hypothetical protein [Gaiellaceae bacterium]